MDSETRRGELRELLERCRGRLRPDDVGLPMTRRRRVPGLRREEVAELVGVSAKWYAVFENGAHHRRFSSGFVQRLAESLRLDESERGMLFRLALPEVNLAVELVERSMHDGALSALSRIRALVRRVTAASSFEDAAYAVVDAVNDILSPSSAAVAILLPNGTAPRVIGIGPRAERKFEHTVIADTCVVANYPNRHGHTTFSEHRSGYRETSRGSFQFRQLTSEGQAFVVSVDATSPVAEEMLAAMSQMSIGAATTGGAFRDTTLNAAEYWEWNSQIGARSVLTHGIFSGGDYRGNLCALWTEPRVMTTVEIEALRTASAILELVAGASRRH